MEATKIQKGSIRDYLTSIVDCLKEGAADDPSIRYNLASIEDFARELETSDIPDNPSSIERSLYKDNSTYIDNEIIRTVDKAKTQPKLDSQSVKFNTNSLIKETISTGRTHKKSYDQKD
jgi:hypothetical protein